jgi:hypothetical protein
VGAADVKAGAADDRDAVFGRFMLTLGQVMRGVQLLKFDAEFQPITAMNGELSGILRDVDDAMCRVYEPLLVAFAASRERAGAVAAG